MVGMVSLEQDFCVWDRVTTQDSPTGVGDTRFAQLIVIGDMKPFVRLRFVSMAPTPLKLQLKLLSDASQG